MYFQKKRVIAMLLAGGQGSRLKVLTEKTAKPAVPFGGKYRIIDFPLSNCVNSGIDTVGILTQYQPLELNEYIGNGQPWNLNKTHSCAQVLPPYERHDKKSGWYKGTANAIYQNIDYIQKYEPQYVVILSADHIYKMDYSKMINFHKKVGADCTIAAINVPQLDAHRFGIINSRADGSIYEFQEKPEKPKSTLASMGIYVFSWPKLLKYLKEDECDSESCNDFGKNILPKMLDKNEKLFAYNFDGYWKDIGTIESLWKCNMDLLNPEINLKLDDESWRIYSNQNELPKAYITDEAKVQDSLISDGCTVYGEVISSVLFSGVYVAEGAKISHSVIMPKSVIKEDAIVNYSIISENVKVGKGAVIEGTENEITAIGDNVTIGDNVKVKPKSMVENDIILRQE